MQIPGDFNTHLFSSEHSLGLQQVNICGLNCKFILHWS